MIYLFFVKEVMRATPEGANRFIESAPGVLSRAKAQQHSLVFGRRGSGKSSLLRKTAPDLTVDRRPIAFVDLETFKGHTFPDVLISVLIKTLSEYEQWLNSAATNPASKTLFWNRFFGAKPIRPPFNKLKTKELRGELKNIIHDLETQLMASEKSNKQVIKNISHENTFLFKQRRVHLFLKLLQLELVVLVRKIIFQVRIELLTFSIKLSIFTKTFFNSNNFSKRCLIYRMGLHF